MHYSKIQKATVEGTDELSLRDSLKLEKFFIDEKSEKNRKKLSDKEIKEELHHQNIKAYFLFESILCFYLPQYSR